MYVRSHGLTGQIFLQGTHGSPLDLSCAVLPPPFLLTQPGAQHPAHDVITGYCYFHVRKPSVALGCRGG